MAEIETFYSISDVAHALGVSTKTVDRWIKSGELAAHKVGRQWRISRTDLEYLVM
jgi:excisionase family DNA binding protein